MKWYNTYEFNVFVEGRSVKEYPHNSKTYIEGRKGSNYELYFRNNSGSRVEVIFSVDGLGIIDGKPASKNSNGYIVNAYDHVRIPGWTISKDRIAKFEFRPKGDKQNSSYVEELKNEGFDLDVGNQGIIGCMVISEKRVRDIRISGSYLNKNYQFDSIPPIFYGDTEQYTRGHATGLCGAGYSALGLFNNSPGVSVNEIDLSIQETSLGTGFGEQASFATTQLAFEKDLTLWTAILNYDTLSNLKKMGVVIETNDYNKAFPGESNHCYVPRNKRG